MWSLLLGLPCGILVATFIFPSLSWQIALVYLILAVICGGLTLFLQFSTAASYLFLRPLRLLGAGLLLGLFIGQVAVMRLQPMPLEPDRYYTLEGQVWDLPKSGRYSSRFLVKVSCLGQTATDCSVYRNHVPIIWPVLVEVSMSNSRIDVRPGQTLRLIVRQKASRSPGLHGGFDELSWMLSKHIVARVSHVQNSRLDVIDAPLISIGRLRWSFAEQLSKNQAVGEWSGLNPGAVLLALITGDRGLLTDAHWELFNRTGTSHLIAISGLHVGLVVLFVVQVTLPLFRRWVWVTHRFPASHCALVIGWVGAIFYAALAGFSLPTQRAMIMVTVVTLLCVFGRAQQLWLALSLAFCLVLVWDPVAALSLGFWLSFGAVFLILWAIGGEIVARGMWRRWLAVQLALFAGLAPILLSTVQSVSLVSVFTNLFAIPIVGFVVVPLSLMWAALWSVLGDSVSFLMQGAAFVMDLTMWLLQQLAYLNYSVWQVGSRGAASTLFAVLGVVWIMTPGLPGRIWGVVLMLPLLVPQSQGAGLYLIGTKQVSLLLHGDKSVISISQSHWPHPVAGWQANLLREWGVSLPESVAVNGGKILWLEAATMVTDFSLSQDALGSRSVTGIRYRKLCSLDGMPGSNFQFRVWRAPDTAGDCVLEFTWDDARWLYWSVARLQAQQAFYQQLKEERYHGVIINLGAGGHLPLSVLRLVDDHGIFVSMQPLSADGAQSLTDRGVTLHVMTEEGDFWLPD